MCTTNEKLANLVAAVQSSALVRSVRYEERLGAKVLRVDGWLGETLAELGPGQVSDRDGDVFRFRCEGELRKVLTAAVHGLERRIREESVVDESTDRLGSRGFSRRGPP